MGEARRTRGTKHAAGALLFGLLGLASGSSAEEPPDPPRGSPLDALLGALLDPLDAGRCPEGRHILIGKVEQSGPDEAGAWTSRVQVHAVRWKSKDDRVYDSGVALAEWDDWKAIGEPVRGRVYLRPTEHRVQVAAFLPEGEFVRTRVGFDGGCVARPEVETAGAAPEVPGWVVLPQKEDVRSLEDVFRGGPRPDEAETTRRAWRAHLARRLGADLPLDGYPLVDPPEDAHLEMVEPVLRAQIAGGSAPILDRLALGRVLAAMDRCAEAIALFDEAIALGAGGRHLELSRIGCLVQAGRAAEAMELLAPLLAKPTPGVVSLCGSAADALGGDSLDRCRAALRVIDPTVQDLPSRLTGRWTVEVEGVQPTDDGFARAPRPAAAPLARYRVMVAPDDPGAWYRCEDRPSGEPEAKAGGERVHSGRFVLRIAGEGAPEILASPSDELLRGESGLAMLRRFEFVPARDPAGAAVSSDAILELAVRPEEQFVTHRLGGVLLSEPTGRCRDHLRGFHLRPTRTGPR